MSNEVAVDGQGGAGEGGGAQGQDIEAFAAIGQAGAVAVELLDVGQGVVGGQHGLGALHVGVAGDDDGLVAVGEVEEGPLKSDQAVVDGVESVAGPEFGVGGDLVVAATGGVEFAADVAEAAR